MQLADFSKPFVVQTDSSSVALGAIIYQEINDTRLPISYASRTLTEQERTFSAYELECLAVVFAFDKFKPFLEHKEFLLETDNQALSWLLNHPKPVSYTHLDVYKRQVPDCACTAIIKKKSRLLLKAHYNHVKSK